MPRRVFSEEDWERAQLVAERVERIKDYVPQEQFHEPTAQMIAAQEIAPYCDNGK